MKISVKKLKNGFEMPVFGIGTWMMGGAMQKDNLNDDKADITALRKAFEQGVTHIDTAEIYAAGHSEEIVAQAIKGYKRDNFFITTKVWKEHLKYDDVLTAMSESLERLQMDYVDLYLIHAPFPAMNFKETMKAMDSLIDQGFTKYIGVSNFSIKQLKEAQSISKYPIVNNQIHYSLAYKDMYKENPLDEIIEYCQENDILVTAYRPVERGILTTKEEPLMKEMCEKYDKTPSQIAINWLVSQDNIVTISKMRDQKHLLENLQSLNWNMDKSDIEKLRKEFPNKVE